MILLSLALLTATPANLPVVIAKAKPGDTIRLAPGDYGMVSIKGRKWGQRVTLDARAARLSIKLREIDGLHVEGGAFYAANERPGYAFEINRSTNVTASGGSVSNAARGVVIGLSQHVAVRGFKMVGLTIDGINIASSQDVLIENNDMRDFVTGKAHPDCIQAWSRPPRPTARVTVTGNRCSGRMQGIFFGNHIRKGVDDGGFDQVKVVGNEIATPYLNGIALYDCRDCEITGNKVRTLPGGTVRRSIIRSKGGSVRMSKNEQ